MWRKPQQELELESLCSFIVGLLDVRFFLQLSTITLISSTNPRGCFSAPVLSRFPTGETYYLRDETLTLTGIIRGAPSHVLQLLVRGHFQEEVEKRYS